MKRFALLFFLGWLAFTATRGHRHHHPAPPPPHRVSSDLRVMVVQDADGRPVTIVEHANDPDARINPEADHIRVGSSRYSVVKSEDWPHEDDRDAHRPPAPPHPPAPHERPIRGLEQVEAKLAQLEHKLRETYDKSGLAKLGKIEINRGDDEKPVAASMLKTQADGKVEQPEVVTGRISDDEERARKDARVLLERRVAEWLGPDVPRTWSRLSREAGRLIVDTTIAPVEKDYGTMYKATLKADLSRANRSEILRKYEREQVGGRLLKLGGALAFALTCLASTVGYIRADEATKGYYTNRLRIVTAACLGAAGYALYQNLA